MNQRGARSEQLASGPDVPSDWALRASRIRIEEWLAPATTEALHPKVHRVLNLARPSVCAWLVGRAQGRLEPAQVYDAVIRRDMVHDMRSNTAANFDYATLDVVQFLVQARMALTCGMRLQQLEAPMVLHYEIGQQITAPFRLH